MNEKIKRNGLSKTTQKADKIRRELKIRNINLGVWTPETLSNGAVIKMYSHLINNKYRL